MRRVMDERTRLGPGNEKDRGRFTNHKKNPQRYLDDFNIVQGTAARQHDDFLGTDAIIER